MEQEIWKDIIWYEGKYQVSNLGNIKSFLSLNWRGIGKEHLLKQNYTKKRLLIYNFIT